MESEKQNGKSWADLDPASEAVVREAVQMLHELDNTPPQQMTPMFYQHWFEQLSITTRDLLRVMGHDPSPDQGHDRS